MALIAQIALGVIIGGLTIALLVIGFFVWNSRQKNERMAIGLFIAGAVIVLVLCCGGCQLKGSGYEHLAKGRCRYLYSLGNRLPDLSHCAFR